MVLARKNNLQAFSTPTGGQRRWVINTWKWNEHMIAHPTSLERRSSSMIDGLYYEKDVSSQVTSQSLLSRFSLVFAGAILAFAIAATTGALMRWWFLDGFPAGINFINVRHAHSHLMYFGWVTPALMALIAAKSSKYTGRANLRGGVLWAGIVLVLGLLTYPPFFKWGYSAAEIGGVRLPVSVIVASLNILAWYGFMIWYWLATRHIPRRRSLRCWDASLFFLFLASLGAWSRAVLVGLKLDNPFLEAAAVHLFLDLFSNGWFMLALLGLMYTQAGVLEQQDFPRTDWLLFAGLPFTFLLGVPTSLTPQGLRILAGAGGIMTAAGVFAHLRMLFPALKDGGMRMWRIPAAFLGFWLVLLIGASFPFIARWGEATGLRVFYLHILLLGFTTLGLFAAAQIYIQISTRIWRFMVAAVLLLLASLLPLSGLWPAAWGGKWTIALAAVFAWGPVLAALAVLLEMSRKAVYSTAKDSRSGVHTI